MLSSTVTVDVQVLLLPLTSVAVNVTLWIPTSLQSKLVWLKSVEERPQASFDPSFTSITDKLPDPAASNCTVTSWQSAWGAILSTTVTTDVQVLVLPLTSVAVSVTVFVPTSPQSKVVLSRLRLASPQGSISPSKICPGVILPEPLASSCTVRSSQSATGIVLSSTETIAVQVLRLPLISVTERVTVCSPTSPQSNTV